MKEFRAKRWTVLGCGIEYEIDHSQNGIQPCGHLVRVWYSIWNSGVANLSFTAHQALGHRWRRDKKSPRDLVRLKAAQRSQRERYPRLGRKRRVAAGEYESKSIVGNFLRVVVRVFDCMAPLGRERFDFFLKASLTSECGRWPYAGLFE